MFNGPSKTDTFPALIVYCIKGTHPVVACIECPRRHPPRLSTEATAKICTSVIVWETFPIVATAVVVPTKAFTSNMCAVQHSERPGAEVASEDSRNLCQRCCVAQKLGRVTVLRQNLRRLQTNLVNTHLVYLAMRRHTYPQLDGVELHVLRFIRTDLYVQHGIIKRKLQQATQWQKKPTV